MYDANGNYKHVTTDATVNAYEATSPIFEGILKEIRELSKKKPDAIMSVSKVRIINRVLDDLLHFLKNEPSGKYLEKLDEDALPQFSDAVLSMVQFESSLIAFRSRYNVYLEDFMESRWITEEFLAD